MLTFLMQNGGTILVTLVLAAIVVLIVYRLVKNKKAGKSSCGCGCSNCAASGQCHSHKT